MLQVALHPTARRLANHRATPQVVDEINELIRPDFVQFIGDNVQDGTDEQFRHFAELRGRLRVPCFAVPWSVPRVGWPHLSTNCTFANLLRTDRLLD